MSREARQLRMWDDLPQQTRPSAPTTDATGLRNAWFDVVSWPGETWRPRGAHRLWASSMGRIAREHHGPWRMKFLKQWTGDAGRSLVLMGRQAVDVANICAHAFHGPWPPDLDLWHANGEKLDNRVGNLRWRLPTGRKTRPSNARPGHLITDREAVRLIITMWAGETDEAASQRLWREQHLDVSRQTISAVRSGRTHAHVAPSMMRRRAWRAWRKSPTQRDPKVPRAGT